MNFCKLTEHPLPVFCNLLQSFGFLSVDLRPAPYNMQTMLLYNE